ncbi:Hsp20/alpha crystallin family protein [bacterium]|nr:Hsp20/alpha crystallin family protein [bacterium]NUN44476.1 Hsp20/alpha crystallin family protein [bacterium]
METKQEYEVKTQAIAKPENNYYYIQPRTDIRENKDSYLLYVEMPGVRKDGLTVTLQNGNLVIEGKMGLNEEGSVIREEIPKRNYHRVFRLTNRVDPNKIEARWQDGFLILSVGKKEELKPREIAINFN